MAVHCTARNCKHHQPQKRERKKFPANNCLVFDTEVKNEFTGSYCECVDVVMGSSMAWYVQKGMQCLVADDHAGDARHDGQTRKWTICANRETWRGW